MYRLSISLRGPSRWEVSIEHRRYLGLNRGAKVLTMNNYLGVGCDAGVALNFHRHRESRPELFQSRFINKVDGRGHCKFAPFVCPNEFLDSCRHGTSALVQEMS